ncbi:hypothetical protein EV401DRAFT_1890793 [Pisolithus croceorrhizus]|nr:hypothetical protein EV401DRAFT_1890793 [Pisolithus croceorrhizus]
MPRGNEEGAPRFSGHPDDLIWFLEDVRDLCMQASCYEDCEWARWSIYYLGIEEFEQWRHLLHAETDWADFLKDATRLFSLFRCPAVCYSKRDLYDLVNKQKKVKIDSYQALLNYRLSFTDIAAQLRISSQLSWIEKDDLFLEGFDQEFQSEILRRLKWNDRRQYVDDPWPTYQVAREAERLLKEGYRFELREVHLARDQWSTREAQYEAEMRESRAAMAEEQCREPERCSESARLGSKASQPPSSTSLEIQSLTHSLQDSSKPSKAPGVGSRSQAVEVDGIESSFECIEIPPIELRDPEDEQRANKRPVEAEAHVLEVAKLVLEPRGDLCEVPEQVRSIEVEEIESGVEAEGQSKVVARRKPPEAKIRRKSLKSVSRRIKEILPEFWTTHSSSRLSGWTISLIYLQQGWTRSLRVETCMTSPSALSQPAKRSGTTALRVNDMHSLAPRTCSAAAVEIYTGLSQKSENYLFKGYESLEGKVEAPHSGGWSTILESTAISSTRKSTKEVASRVRTPQIPYMKMQKPPCVKGEARQLREGPHLWLLWRVFSVFLEDALWSSKPLSRPLLRSSNPALSHWTLILVRGLMLSCEYLRVSRAPRESEEVAKRSPSLVHTDASSPFELEGPRYSKLRSALEGSQAKCHCHFRYIPTASSPSSKGGIGFEPPSSSLLHASIWTFDPSEKASCLDHDPRPLRKGFVPRSRPSTPLKRLRASIATLDPFKKASRALIWTLDPFVKASCLNCDPRPLRKGFVP